MYNAELKGALFTNDKYADLDCVRFNNFVTFWRFTVSLTEYVRNNTIKCSPEDADADVIFFGVRKTPDATAEALKEFIYSHKGEFCEVNPLDGKEHGYIELGGWVGDQGDALLLIGLGAALGIWKLLTPKTIMGDFCPPDIVHKMAGMGMVSVQAAP